jgi:5-methylcytosine-specific restriction endonuclease McrA
MNKIISVIIATLIGMSFVAIVFASEGNKSIIIADHNAATSAGGIRKDKRTVNPAEKAAKARTKADHKYLKAKAKTDAKDADAKAAKEKNEADVKAAKDLDTNLK